MIHRNVHYSGFTVRSDLPRVQHPCGYRTIRRRSMWKANKSSVIEDVCVRHEVRGRYICRLSLDIGTLDKTSMILASVIIGGGKHGLLAN